ncbi:hypothetical protein BPT24_271 [Tenacibaculum phage pT24]|uniref:Uncharacterized protein n=1 Tax=Tenacibaculum phage pT24 TaxID=1880590 RepID=A0A1W7GKR2_9CAUD|nr:hypothetical protein HYP10_gp257 [Tenacibaculum phage pT24]BAX25566.1 hypothetical protein BPT24_271 [Tenacibaculum phage pT24]
MFSLNTSAQYITNTDYSHIVSVFRDTNGSFGLALTQDYEKFYMGLEVENLYNPNYFMMFNFLCSAGYNVRGNDWVLRFGGRLGFANVNYKARRPAIGGEVSLEQYIDKSNSIYLGVKVTSDYYINYHNLETNELENGFISKLFFRVGYKIN